MPVKKKNPGGRPSKFTPELQNQIKLMSRRGWTDVQMCELLDIDESTLTKWKQSKPKFFMSLNDWKLQADHEVVKSLYERACGYEHPETKAQFVDGEWKTLDMTKHYPPDSTSMIFWLKNRLPKEFRDKVEHGFTDQEGNDLKWVTETVKAKKDA